MESFPTAKELMDGYDLSKGIIARILRNNPNLRPLQHFYYENYHFTRLIEGDITTEIMLKFDDMFWDDAESIFYNMEKNYDVLVDKRFFYQNELNFGGISTQTNAIIEAYRDDHTGVTCSHDIVLEVYINVGDDFVRIVSDFFYDSQDNRHFTCASFANSYENLEEIASLLKIVL